VDGRNQWALVNIHVAEWLWPSNKAHGGAEIPVPTNRNGRVTPTWGLEAAHIVMNLVWHWMRNPQIRVQEIVMRQPPFPCAT